MKTFLKSLGLSLAFLYVLFGVALTTVHLQIQEPAGQSDLVGADIAGKNVVPNNVSVTTVTVSGVSSLRGGFISNASSTVAAGLQVAGNLSASSTMSVAATTTLSDGLVSTKVTNIGWSVVNSANQACNTTCTSACVFGEDTAVLGQIVDCSSAIADTCVCAGPS